MRKTSPVKMRLPEALDRFKKARVMVMGDIMHDVFIWGKVKRISPEAPVPVVEVTKETSLLGGAANVVNNIRALGAKAFMAGVLGTDAAGEAVLKALEDIKADRSSVVRSKGRPTAVKTRIIAHQQQVVRYDLEEKRELKPATRKKLWRAMEDNISKVDAVILSDYNKGLISKDLAEKIVGLCADKGKVLAVDPKPDHFDWYRGATIVTPNNAEASEASGIQIETEEDLYDAGSILLERLESEALLITRGEKGMSLFRRGRRPVHIPARAREVFDVTGAGDTVIAALTVAMVAGMDLADAVKAANIAAGIVVGKLGTSTATVEEIKAASGNRNRKKN